MTKARSAAVRSWSSAFPRRWVAHGSRSRGRFNRDDAGAQLVEFALVVPLFCLLLFGLIDFGMIFGGFIAMRAGVGAGARAAAVNDAAFTGGVTCTGGPNTATADMVCSVVNKMEPLAGATSSSLSVGICFFTAGSTTNTCSSQSSAGTSLSDDVEVCADAKLTSTTGITSPFVSGKTVTASSRQLIEQPQPSGATAYEAFNSSSTAVVYKGTTTIKGMNCS